MIERLKRAEKPNKTSRTIQFYLHRRTEKIRELTVQSILSNAINEDFIKRNLG